MKKGLLILYFGVVSLGLASSSGPQNVKELFGDPTTLGTVISPDRVDACVLRYVTPTPDNYDAADYNKDKKVRYQETEFVPLSGSATKALQSILLDESTYGWTFAKGCDPVFQVRVRFFRGSHSVWVDFCFGCKILEIAKDGEWFSGEDFDNAKMAILDVFISTFPTNSALKKIKDEETKHDIEKTKRLEEGKKRKV